MQELAGVEYQPVLRYRLTREFGQQDDRVEIMDLWDPDKRKEIISVRELANKRYMMAQFNGNDACSIGYIYANATANVVVKR